MSEKIVQLNEEVIKGAIERTEAGYRSGHYNRSLTTTAGEVTQRMPRLKGISFETVIIERCRSTLELQVLFFRDQPTEQEGIHPH